MNKKSLSLAIILFSLLFLLNPLAILASDNPPCEILDIDSYQTKVDFSGFKIEDEMADISCAISPSEITIIHNESIITDSKGKFIIEYNLGNENFSDFDISVDVWYNITLPIFWGELFFSLGSDSDSEGLYQVEKSLCFASIRDPWGGEDGMVVVGAFTTSAIPEEHQFTPSDLLTPGTLTFHMNRTDNILFCEIIQNTIPILSHSWDSDVSLICNFIQIRLEYWSEVDDFSFKFSNLNATLDVFEQIPPSGFTFSLPAVSIGFVFLSLNVITIIMLFRKKTKSYR